MIYKQLYTIIFLARKVTVQKGLTYLHVRLYLLTYVRAEGEYKNSTTNVIARKILLMMTDCSNI